MSNNFDDLVNDFLKPKGPKRGKILGKIIDTIVNFTKMKTDEELEDAINKNLGEPDIIEEFEEDGLHIQRLVWNTPEGQFMKIVANPIDVEDFVFPQKKLTLEEQLEKAVEDEDYTLAIQLRDKIKAQKK